MTTPIAPIRKPDQPGETWPFKRLPDEEGVVKIRTGGRK